MGWAEPACAWSGENEGFVHRRNLFEGLDVIENHVIENHVSENRVSENRVSDGLIRFLAGVEGCHGWPVLGAARSL
jgi:hypothetical protein